jgi:uncharacterized protein (UPF0332 family)
VTGSVRQHYERWQHNERLSSDLKAMPTIVDWWIVLRFYAALHLVQAYLVSKGASPDTHSARKIVMRSHGFTELARVCATYFDLHDLSADVRYSPTFRATPQQETEADERYARIVAFLQAKVERWLAANDPKAPPPP